MNSKILWRASQTQKKYSNLFRYENFLSLNYNLKLTKDFNKLLKWSIKNPQKF